MKRIRIGGQHRGWTAAQRKPESVARDILASIRQHAELGVARAPECYTQEPVTLALVRAALAAKEGR